MARIDWLAPIHMNAAITTTHSVLTMSPPARPPEKNGITSSAMASARPTQAAAIVAVFGLPVIFQMTARSIRPPSSGSPGSRLKMPTMMFAYISCRTSDAAHPVR